MTEVKPFRFGVQSRSLGPRDQWLEMIRRVEALGYDAITWPDHFVRGLEPVVALSAAAMVTTNLKLTGFLFDNDFRHPVVLAMSANSIDVLSEGRLELGIGAGWLKEEYEQSGIPFDPFERSSRPTGRGGAVAEAALDGQDDPFLRRVLPRRGTAHPTAAGAEAPPAADHRWRQPAHSLALRRERPISSASPLAPFPTAPRTPPT